jgi:drug/metabolite transporter (DMT)-like permease
MILLAFIGMSLAWSFSWFAMKLQVESLVPLELSVFYRFALTSILMFGICLISKQRLWLKKSEIKFLIYIGITNFCLNFLIGYFAVQFVASGVLATIFCLSIISSEIILAKVDRRKIAKKILLSSLIGFVGLIFFVAPIIDFSKYNETSKSLTGIGLCLIMMLIYSSGNVVVGKNRAANQTPLFTLIAYGSGIGSVFLMLFNLARGNEFVFDFSPQYLLSLSYLILVASVLAFICLFYLIQKIGSAKANYTALIYPMLALAISAYFENFVFNIFNLVGFALIIVALAVEFLSFSKKKLVRKNVASSKSLQI